MTTRTIAEIDAEITAAETAKADALDALKHLRAERREAAKAFAARARAVGARLAEAAAAGDTDAAAILSQYDTEGTTTTAADGGADSAVYDLPA